MWQLDTGHVLQRLRIEDRQLASIDGAVIDIAHQHPIVLRSIRRRRMKDELAQRFIGPECASFGIAADQVVLEQHVITGGALPDRRCVAVPMPLAD